MKTKPTFFNTRRDRLHDNHIDTNNYLFIIFYDNGAEMSFVLRDLKKDKRLLNYIYNKINTIFGNVAEIYIDKISKSEYNILRLNGIPPITKLCLMST